MREARGVESSSGVVDGTALRLSHHAVGGYRCILGQRHYLGSLLECNGEHRGI